MLILFDLDDCIIDTSNSITPSKLKFSLEVMQKKGLAISNFQKFYKLLLAINAKSGSSFETIKVFLEKIKADQKFFPIAWKVMQDPLPEGIRVEPRKGALSLLKELKKNHRLCLITIGNELVQKQKLRKAGIDSSLFSIISVLQSSCKGVVYRFLAEKYEMKPMRVVVCGDRIEVDLKPAKELGYTTIHTCWGRGRQRQYYFNPFVDYEVTNLCEILSIIKALDVKE